MILTDLRSVTAYRMHMPKWATAPMSGAGTATHGGRANRPGVQALSTWRSRRTRPYGSINKSPR